MAVVREMAVYFKNRKLAGKGPESVKVSDSRDVARVFHFLKDKCHEEAWAALLSADNSIQAIYQVGKGGMTSCNVPASEVFKAALLANTPAFLLVHNHPSGNVMPSATDRELTRELTAGAKLLGLAFLDHVIIGNGRHYSFATTGNL